MLQQREVLLRPNPVLRERVASVPVFPRVGVDDLRKALGGPLPDQGQDAKQVLTDLAKNAEPGLVASVRPHRSVMSETWVRSLSFGARKAWPSVR